MPKGKSMPRSRVNLKVNQNQKWSKCKCVLLYICVVKSELLDEPSTYVLLFKKIIYNLIYFLYYCVVCRGRHHTNVYKRLVNKMAIILYHVEYVFKGITIIRILLNIGTFFIIYTCLLYCQENTKIIKYHIYSYIVKVYIFTTLKTRTWKHLFYGYECFNIISKLWCQ